MLRKIAIKRNSLSISGSDSRNDEEGNLNPRNSSGIDESNKLFSSSEQHVEEDEEALPFTVDYLGFDHISEAQSVPLMKETLKKIKKHHTKTVRVDFVIQDGILKVSNVSQGALLITAPLYAVALCAQEQLRGFDSTFAINITRRRVHLCHVFQAGSRLEASSIVRSVALAFKSVGKLLKERRHRVLLTEPSLSSSERIRTESDGSKYRNRTESEGSKDRQRPSVDVTPARKRRASAPANRNKTAIGPSTLVELQSEGTSDSSNRFEVVTAQIHRDVDGKRQNFHPHETRDFITTRSISVEVHCEEERHYGYDIDHRELSSLEERNISDITEDGRRLYAFDDENRSGDQYKVDELFVLAASAIESGNIKQLEIYLDSGLSVNSRDSKGLSLLHHAALRNEAEVVGLLLEREADPNCEGPDDETPLHCSAGQGNRIITKLLLEHGANVRAQDRLFRTPLHMCAGNLQSLEVSFILVEHGARIEDNDLEGTRPVDLQPELQEMQNRLIQSACEAFTASDLSKSRSDSGSTSSRSSSLRSGKGLLPSQPTRRTLHKSSSFKRHSLSLQSIPDDNSDEDETRQEKSNSSTIQDSGSTLEKSQPLQSESISAEATFKGESFDSEIEFSRDETYLHGQARIYEPKVNDAFLGKLETNSHEKQFLNTYHTNQHKFPIEKRISFHSESECSANSVKVETDSIGLDEDDFAPLIIQDFKDTDVEFSNSFLESNINIEDHKNRLLSNSIVANSRSRTSTRKDEKETLVILESHSTDDEHGKAFDTHIPMHGGTVELAESPMNSITGSSQDITDSATISDNESITNLRSCLHSKLPKTDRSSLSSYKKLFKKDPASDALRLLVTLSFNPECHSSILASLCLPNSAGQLVAAARSPKTSLHHLNQIASLLGNLFTVSGPESRRKAVEAGLLKTVIDTLETPEPVQGTCLSILNDLLQSENEKDYSMAITNVPLEPLLIILERNITAKKQHAEKLQMYQERTPLLHAESSSSSARRLLHQPLHTHFLEKDCEPSNAKPIKREPKFLSEKRTSEKELLKDAVKLSDNLPYMHFMPPPDGLGRGRSDSFSSQSSRESSPSSVGKISSKSNSVSDVRLGESLPAVGIRQRRSSRGSGYSTDGSSTSSNLVTSSQLCQPMVAKNIAVKMLAAVSSNPKFHIELSQPRIIQILLHCLKDTDLEVAIQAAMALSNVAMNINTHSKLEAENVIESLEASLKHSNIRVRYHAARGMIYLGHFNVEGIHLFAALEADETLSNVIYAEITSQQEHYYVRGTSVESLVLMLTKDINLLWGGSSLSPPSPGDRKGNSRGYYVPGKESNRHSPSEQQILSFIFTMYPSFVHPVILMRLSLHRFHDPTHYKKFEELEENGHVESIQANCPLPMVHARLMRVWLTWLESYPGDFRRSPIILEELNELVEPMRTVGGPYLPCAERLEALMNKIKADGSSRGSERSNHTENHHDVIYEQCQKAIISGAIPCTEDDFIYLASLQLYIEDLEEYGPDFPQRNQKIASITPARLKQSVHPSLASSKNALKRIKLQYDFIMEECPTNRNAKHNYIDCCQGIEGFGCRFFKLKQKVPAKGGKKHNNITRLLGISSKRVAILDDQTKACIAKWNFKDLKRWGTTEDNLYLKLSFKNKTAEFQMDSKSIFKELSNYILKCSMEMGRQGFGNLDTNPWSTFAENTGIWGVPALRLYLSELRNETESSPTGKIESPLSCRERSVTFAPSSPREPTKPLFRRAQAYHNNDVSRSAPEPTDQDTEMPSSVFDWLPFRGRKSRACSGRSDLSPPIGQSAAGSPSSPSTEATSPRRMKIRRSSNSPKSHVEFTPVSVFEQHLSSPSHTSSSILSQSSNERAPMLDGAAENEPSTKTVEKIQKDLCKTIAKISYCRCPPDAQLPNLNRRDFSAFELLQHPKELARQITLIDHELFRAMSSRDIQRKVSIGTLRKIRGDNSSQTVEKVAQRFNQLSNWVCVCIVSERNIERRAQMFINFVETAKQCLELRNYNSVMAIVVAALGSAPVRRLKITKEKIPHECLSHLNKMESLMDTKGNHKRYREALRTSPTPAVPYFGLYLKDLTFITDGNPDFLTNGLINLNKRRQIYVLLEEIHRFQRKKYNFQRVHEVREYLYSRPYVPEDQLHQMSREIEPPIHSKFAAATPQTNTPSSLDRLQSNLLRCTSTGKVIGRRTLGIMKTNVNNVVT